MATVLNQKAGSLGSILAQHREEILAEWLREMSGSTRRSDLMNDAEVKSQCTRFLDLLIQAAGSGGSNSNAKSYDPMRSMLEEISRSRALQGFTPSETAIFVFSIKRPLFTAIRQELGGDADAIAQEMWAATEL